MKNRSVAKFLSPEKTARSDALGVGFSMEATDLLSLSETVTSCAAGPVIIPFSLDKIASWPRLSPYRNLPASASRFHLMPVLKQFRSMFRPRKIGATPKEKDVRSKARQRLGVLKAGRAEITSNQGSKWQGCGRSGTNWARRQVPISQRSPPMAKSDFLNEIAQWMWAARQQRLPFRNLPDELRPGSIIEAYKAQEA